MGDYSQMRAKNSAQAFCGQESGFALSAPAVAPRSAGDGQNPVTGHQDRQRVGSDSPAHRPGSPRLTNLSSHLPIRPGGAARDTLQGAPDPLLKIGTDGRHVDLALPAAGKNCPHAVTQANATQLYPRPVGLQSRYGDLRSSIAKVDATKACRRPGKQTVAEIRLTNIVFDHGGSLRHDSTCLIDCV